MVLETPRMSMSSALAEEPFADLAVGSLEGGVEAVALGAGKRERKKR